MTEPLQVACPNCAQQPGEECFTAGRRLERFHAERYEMALSISGMEQGAAPGITKPELVEEAIGRAVDALL